MYHDTLSLERLEDRLAPALATGPIDLTLVQVTLAALHEAPAEAIPGQAVAPTLPPVPLAPVYPPTRGQPGIEGSLTTVERSGGSDSPRPIVVEVAEEPPRAEEGVGRGPFTPQPDERVAVASDTVEQTVAVEKTAAAQDDQ